MTIIPQDKLLHLLVGAVIAMLFHPFGLAIAFTLLFLAAIGREAYNKFKGGKFDLYDILATAWGGAMAMAWVEIMYATYTPRWDLAGVVSRLFT